MNITVVGTGYVGLVAGACLAETGNAVVCADVDAAKIEGLTRNVLPIYEPGLDALVERNQRDGRLRFTTDVGAGIAAADVVFIAVGTPPDEDGSADLCARARRGDDDRPAHDPRAGGGHQVHGARRHGGEGVGGHRGRRQVPLPRRVATRSS